MDIIDSHTPQQDLERAFKNYRCPGLLSNQGYWQLGLIIFTKLSRCPNMRLASKTTHVNNIPLSELAITAAQVGGILKQKMETGGLNSVCSGVRLPGFGS